MGKKIQITKNGFILFLSICMTAVLTVCLDDSERSVHFINTVLLITYACVLCFTLRRHGFFSLQGLFLISLCVFSFFGIFLSVVGIGDYKNAQEMVHMTWTNLTAKTVSTYYIIFLACYTLLCSDYKVSKNKELRNDSYCNNGIGEIKLRREKTAQWIMFIFFGIALFQKMIELKMASTYGFAAVYAGAGEHSLAQYGMLSYVIKGGNLIFEVTYFYLLSQIPGYKRFCKCSLLYLALTGLSFLSGNRSDLIVALFYILYYRYKVYGKKLNIGKTFALMVMVIFALWAMALIRQGESLSGYGIADMLKSTLVDTSGSVNVLAYYIQNKEALSGNTYPYMLDSIFRLPMVLLNRQAFNSGQSMDMIAIRANLNHQMTYHIFPNKYLAGKGLGNNFIAEFSEFGMLGVILGSILASILIRIAANQLFGKRISIFFSFLMFNHVLYMPRSEAFFDTYTLVKYLLCYFVFSFILDHVTLDNREGSKGKLMSGLYVDDMSKKYIYRGGT